jgi:hypothetical protein
MTVALQSDYLGRHMRPSSVFSRRETAGDAIMESGIVTLSYLLYMVPSACFLWFLNHFWGDKILLTFHDLQGKGFAPEGLGHVWFIFAWGFVVTLGAGLLLGRSSDTPRVIAVLKGWWVSLNAGVFEELIFRWMVFFSAMVLIPFVNWLTLGLVKWFYVHVSIPIANFFTFHALDAQLHDPRSWVLGAALISASISFRDRHKYLGPIGWVNSWFGGMVLFWLVFHYGLLTAIVAHILYDVVVFTTSELVPEK